MDIFVDEQPYLGATDDLQTVGDLAGRISRDSGDPRRLVVGLCCDGQLVEPDRLEAVLASPLTSYQRIDLQTQPLAALLHGALEQAAALAADVRASRDRAADLLAEGQLQPAMQHLQRFFEAWGKVHESIAVCAEALGCGLDDLAVGDRGLAEVLDSLKTQLADLREALLSQDLVVVGDILRYEMNQPLDDLDALLAGLRSQAG